MNTSGGGWRVRRSVGLIGNAKRRRCGKYASHPIFLWGEIAFNLSLLCKLETVYDAIQHVLEIMADNHSMNPYEFVNRFPSFLALPRSVRDEHDSFIAVLSEA